MRLGEFQILALLGKGAFGAVYLARKRDTGEVVAVKVRHPNVVQTILQDLSSLEFLTDAVCPSSLSPPFLHHLFPLIQHRKRA